MEEKLNITLLEANDWFITNSITLNKSKTQLLYFTSKLANNYRLSNNPNIQTVLHTQDLGITVYCTFNWETSHISELLSELISACFAFQTIIDRIVNNYNAKSWATIMSAYTRT